MSPPTTDLLPDARRRVEAQVDIQAPIDVVWRVLTDLPRYGEWNPFVVAARAPAGLAVGARLSLSVRMGPWPGRVGEIIERVTPPDPEGLAEWVYRFAGPLPRIGALHGQRVQRLRALDAHTTRYESTEAFTGWLAALVPIGAVQRGIDAMAQGLARQSEALAKPSAQAQ